VSDEAVPCAPVSGCDGFGGRFGGTPILGDYNATHALAEQLKLMWNASPLIAQGQTA